MDLVPTYEKARGDSPSKDKDGQKNGGKLLEVLFIFCFFAAFH